MTANTWLQLGVYFAVLLAAAVPLGSYMARVYGGEAVWLRRVLGPLERWLYRLAGTGPEDEMPWTRYAAAVLAFSALSVVVVYALQRAQALLPFNPARLAAVPAVLAFNTAVSFATNTDWQSYSGEATLSGLAQALALGVQNFVSAAAGMAVLIALIRGFKRAQTSTIGNFWVDLVRGTLYILLPLSILLAVMLTSQGVVQTWRESPVARMVESHGSQTLAVGSVASQVAIKQLGTNGGGYYNANSAHPFENPTPLSGFLELEAILIISAGLCHTFGKMIGDRRQGWALLTAMTVTLAPLVVGVVHEEQQGTPQLARVGADLKASASQAGGNMEGKEVRFGIANSALWAAATTAASNGSVNATHDSFTPLGGLVPLWLMQLGEVIYGGVGSGLYGMLVFAIIAVFIAGLMVGRTPEYLGKKIDAHEMKMAALVILVPAAAVLVLTALAVSLPAGRAGILNPGPHGFSEVLYAYSSTANNNGSAFAGLTPNAFYNLTLAMAMWAGRLFIVVPVLAIAGSLARKKVVPASAGTLPTHTPLFVVLLIGTVLLVGALTFLPALALGPIVEHLQMTGMR